MNIAMWLARRAQSDPRLPALFSGRDLVVDYAGLYRRALQLGAWLQGQGVAPGDRVALFAKNSPEYLIIKYAIWCAGAVAVPINAKLHGREAAFILAQSGARLVFSSSDLLGALDGEEVTAGVVDIGGAAYDAAFATPPLSAPVGRVPQDLAWLFYTSGTTGRPKGVMITHRMIMAMSLSYLADVEAVSAAQATLYAAPMSHGAGIYSMIFTQAGARHVVPPSGGFEPREIFDLARHHGQVQMFAAPTMVKRMTDYAQTHGQRGVGLETVVYAGGPMYQADILAAVAQFGPKFVQIYGQGECPMGITALSRADVADRTHPRWQERLGSVGRAQTVSDVRIADATGTPLAPGETGEIMVRGDLVMPGYWDAPEATAKALVDGWLMTGDMGSLDDDGYLTLKDRSKDMIISGGSNIYPREVEEVLLRHPDVREVSVVGRPHAEWGEEVVAFVVGCEDWPDLDRLCQEYIARFKRPKAYLALPELPKNNYGKVLKTALRDRLKEGRE